jgi:hypothetical protein
VDLIIIYERAMMSKRASHEEEAARNMKGHRTAYDVRQVKGEEKSYIFLCIMRGKGRHQPETKTQLLHTSTQVIA